MTVVGTRFCRNVGWAGGLCLTHRLYHWDWRWNFGNWMASIDLHGVPLPQIRIGRDEGWPPNWVSFDFGTVGNDPIFSFGWERGMAARRKEFEEAHDG
jgi:hypothetical protein